MIDFVSLRTQHSGDPTADSSLIARLLSQEDVRRFIPKAEAALQMITKRETLPRKQLMVCVHPCPPGPNELLSGAPFKLELHRR